MSIPVIRAAVAIWLAIVFWALSASAQEPFYRGKTIRIIVGFSAGGGFDAYSRAIARQLRSP